jgi:hypothetical protein
MVPCTFLLDRNRNRHVAYFNWNDKASEWVLLPLPLWLLDFAFFGKIYFVNS